MHHNSKALHNSWQAKSLGNKPLWLDLARSSKRNKWLIKPLPKTLHKDKPHSNWLTKPPRKITRSNLEALNLAAKAH